MAIIALKAWYLESYEPIATVVQRTQDLRLNRSSLLKSGLRADFLDDSAAIETSVWFRRYLEGENIEFYIEGSGSYEIANVDLRSQEIYFTKKDVAAWLNPVVYVSSQQLYLPSSEAIAQQLQTAIDLVNQETRLALTIQYAPPLGENPWRLSSTQLRQIRQCLIYIADITPISQINQQLLISPNVCIELGYMLQHKKTRQILLLNQERPELTGQMPFDLPQQQQLSFKTPEDLAKTLPLVLKNLLQPYIHPSRY